MSDNFYIEMIFSFFTRGKRFRRFTSLRTLRRVLRLSFDEARGFVHAAVRLNLGRRRNQTPRREGGIEWNLVEVARIRAAR